MNCDGSHAYLKIPAINQEDYRSVTSGFIHAGSKTMSLEDWNTNLKTTYSAGELNVSIS